eukprot:COSAG05_NODE_7704_length_777_cov_5.156342_2_plen_225_part_01
MLDELIQQCAALWTRGEAAALDAIKQQLPEVRAVLECGPQEDRVRVLAALGPQWWMNGLAKEGSARASKHAAGIAHVDWREISTASTADAADSVFERELPPPELELTAAPFLSDGTSARVLLGCCLDGGGMNAYAHSDLEGAAVLHGQALRLAQDELAHLGSPPTTPRDATSHWDARVLKSRALDGMGRVARVSGDYAASYLLHVLAAEAVTQSAAAGHSSADPS